MFVFLIVMGMFPAVSATAVTLTLRGGGQSSGIVIATYEGKTFAVCMKDGFNATTAELLCADMNLPSSETRVRGRGLSGLTGTGTVRKRRRILGGIAQRKSRSRTRISRVRRRPKRPLPGTSGGVNSHGFSHGLRGGAARHRPTIVHPEPYTSKTGTIDALNVKLRCDGTDSDCEFYTDGDFCHSFPVKSLPAVSCSYEAVTLKIRGGGPSSGIVLANYTGKDVAVCIKDGFDSRTAGLMCADMNLPSSNPVIMYPNQYTNKTGKITALNVKLRCNETDSDCEFYTDGDFCDSVEIKSLPAVFCTDQAIQFRLTSLPNESIGRLEVKINQTWGPVCAKVGSLSFAEAACKAMALPSSDARYYRDLFRGGDFDEGYLPLNNCENDENNPGRFTNVAAGAPCKSDQYVGLTCETAIEKQVRVASGSTSAVIGIAQVYHDGQWAGIGVNSSAAVRQRVANVICTSLKGSATEARLLKIAHHESRLWLNNVSCQGGEADLFQCSGADLGSVQATTQGAPLYLSCEADDDAVRLGADNLLQIRHHGRWGTVCRGFFRNREAAAVCQELGRPSSLASWRTGSNNPPRTGTIWQDGYYCNTTEWDECLTQVWGDIDCTHDTDVFIECGSYDRASVKYRLTDTPIPDLDVGYVEMAVNETWGTVCNGGFGTPEAKVVCRSLNKPTDGARVIKSDLLPRNRNTKMWLTEVQCTGQEHSILDCKRNYLGDGQCTWILQGPVAVFCGPPAEQVDGTIRLVGKVSEPSRVDIMIFGQWMSICDHNITSYDAARLCSRLSSTSRNSKVATSGTFPRGTGEIWMTRIKASDITFGYSFSYRPDNRCDHSQDLGLVCQTTSAAGTSMRIGLVAGKSLFSLGFLNCVVVVVLGYI